MKGSMKGQELVNDARLQITSARQQLGRYKEREKTAKDKVGRLLADIENEQTKIDFTKDRVDEVNKTIAGNIISI
jgi:peptidoglycan hydrolase CwlO-like protein